jgi:hypothetical protein
MRRTIILAWLWFAVGYAALVAAVHFVASRYEVASQ